jgi:hypothetical protein
MILNIQDQVQKMEIIKLYVGTEVPPLFSKLAIHFPNSNLFAFCYVASLFKYSIWDIYQYQVQSENETLTLFLGGVLLLNIGRFCNMLSSQFKTHMTNDFYFQLNENISAFTFFGRALAVWLSGHCPPHVFVVHMTLAISAHSYFTDFPKHNSFYNYYFYIFATHFLMIMQVWNALLENPMLLALSVYCHLLGFFQQIRIHYLLDENPAVAEFITNFCSCLDFFMLHLVEQNLSTSMLGMWQGSLELYTVFMLLYFESFGHMTHAVTQLFLISHSTTVARLSIR